MIGTIGRCVIKRYLFATASRGAIRPIWSSLRNVYHPDLEVEEVPLFTLDRKLKSQISEWKTFDDRNYGGNSLCEVQEICDEGFIRLSGRLDLDEEKADELEADLDAHTTSLSGVMSRPVTGPS